MRERASCGRNLRMLLLWMFTLAKFAAYFLLRFALDLDSQRGIRFGFRFEFELELEFEL